MKGKKAQSAIEGLQALVIPLVGIGLVLAIGFLIFAEATDQVISSARSDETGSVAGESILWNNGSRVAFVKGPQSMTLSCDGVINATGAVLIGTANYTCTKDGLLLIGTDWNTTVGVNYSYSNKSLAYNATGETQNATAQLSGWLPIIVITVIGAILLGLVGLFRRT